MVTITYENNNNNIVISGVLDAINTEEIIALPFIANGYTIQATPTAGNCSVWVSNDGDNWLIWDSGSVSVTAITALIPTRYMKIVNTTSTSTAYSVWGF